MSSAKISKGDVFIVAPGRSVLTARRGMAHAGGKITLADIKTGNPAKVMAGYVKTGKVELDKEATAAAKAAEAATAKRADEAVAAAAKRAEDAKTKAPEETVVPPTEAEIVEAIGKLDPENKEQWTTGGAPQVSSLEDLLGKQISAADRDAAWAVVEAGAK